MTIIIQSLIPYCITVTGQVNRAIQSYNRLLSTSQLSFLQLFLQTYVQHLSVIEKLV